MNDLKKANEARYNKALNKKYNFDEFGVCSFKELIDKNTFIKSEIGNTPVVRFNRTKFNRMNNEQQKEYLLKTEKTKIEYRLYYNSSVFTAVHKCIFDYFNQVNNEDNLICITCGKELSDLEHNYGTDEMPQCIICGNEDAAIQLEKDIKNNLYGEEY